MGMSMGHDPGDDEDPAALFRDAIGPVRELPAQALPPAKPKPRPRARMARLDEDEALLDFRAIMAGHAPLDVGDVLSYRSEQISPAVLKRLAQGQYAPQEELDLHRTTVEQAAQLLRLFLRDAREAGLGCVRIIHGKGMNSEGLPVLKHLVDAMLRQRAQVLAFHSAPPAQGGTGVVLVLLDKD